MDEGEELPRIEGDPLALEPGLQRVGKRHVHVVAAEENVLADADPLQTQFPPLLGDCHQAEIGGSAADVTDQHQVPGAHLSPPFFAGTSKKTDWFITASTLPIVNASSASRVSSMATIS